MQTKLIVNGVDIPAHEHCRFTLRWVSLQSEDRSFPVLYRDGKRLVVKWSLNLSAETPPDPAGGNANTE